LCSRRERSVMKKRVALHIIRRRAEVRSKYDEYYNRYEREIFYLFIFFFFRKDVDSIVKLLAHVRHD
jgi:hypothetical protein